MAVLRPALSVVALLSFMVVTSVLADCVSDSAKSMEERTRRVPIVVKGIIVAQSQTGNRRNFTIRVGKVLKGGNESVASVRVTIVVVDEFHEALTSLATAGLTNDQGTVTERTTLVAGGEGSTEGTTAGTTTGGGLTSTAPDRTFEKTTLVAGDRDEGSTEGTTTGCGLASTTTERTFGSCLEGMVVLERYVFFLMPMDEEGMVFEVVEEGVPQSKDNLRRIRQTVKEEHDANITLPDDDHIGTCTDPRYTDHFCLNGGTCSVWINLDKYFCICHYPYYGERCDKIDPGASTDRGPVVINDTTMALAVIMSTMLILTVICVIAFIKYKNNLWRERKRDVEKTVRYLQERYPSMNSRRNSPIQGISRINNNSSSNATDEGPSQMIVFQDAEGKQGRQESLADSNQYRLLKEVRSPHRGSVDHTDRMANPGSSLARSSIV